MSKAGVKAFTEGLQHELRNMDGCQLTAHLMIPAYVYSMLRPKRIMFAKARAKKAAALAAGGTEAEAEAAFQGAVQAFDNSSVPSGEHQPDKKPEDAWTGDEVCKQSCRNAPTHLFSSLPTPDRRLHHGQAGDGLVLSGAA